MQQSTATKPAVYSHYASSLQPLCQQSTATMQQSTATMPAVYSHYASSLQPLCQQSTAIMQQSTVTMPAVQIILNRLLVALTKKLLKNLQEAL